MTTKCTGIMGRIFGHKFRPVITLSASKFNSTGVACKAHVALEMADKHRDESFHGCICQRCGAISGSQHSEEAAEGMPIVEPGFHDCHFDNEPRPYGVTISGEKK